MAFWETLCASSELWVKFVNQRLLAPPPEKALDHDWCDVYWSWCRVCHEPQNAQLIARCCDASTTDQSFQSIVETLESDPETFWSSTGTAEPDCADYLVYELREPLSLVTGVTIDFYDEERRLAHPFYKCGAVQLSFGYHLSETGGLLSSTYCHFVDILDTEMYTPVDVTLPVAVPARYLMIEFLEKLQRDPYDGLFYTAVRKVDVKGYCMSICYPLPPLLIAVLDTASQDASFLPFLRRYDPALHPLPPYPCAHKASNPTLRGLTHGAFIPLQHRSSEISSLADQFALTVDFKDRRRLLDDLAAYMRSS